jgi:signal transduction histidine kinase
MSVPLLHDGKIFGVLNINAAKGKTFTDSDLVAATEFSRHAADALAAARLYEAERRRGAERPEQHLESMLEHLRVAAEVDFVGPIELVPVDVMAIARSLAELEDKAGRPTGVRGPATALVMGDGRLLRRVLRELIDNGHRHGEAPVRMIFEKESEDHIVLSVSDSGQGVPVKDRPKVFEPYGRVDGGDDSGLGLGLSMARRLVEHMGGALSVIDTPVGGASFRMRLAAA